MFHEEEPKEWVFSSYEGKLREQWLGEITKTREVEKSFGEMSRVFCSSELFITSLCFVIFTTVLTDAFLYLFIYLFIYLYSLPFNRRFMAGVSDKKKNKLELTTGYTSAAGSFFKLF